MSEDYLGRKKEALLLRSRIIQSIRRWFLERDFLEVETPCRMPAPAPESHIDAVASGEWFLQTSPELCMKRLLAAGYPRIFQICRCFREKERGSRHLPEFTMLEWYREGADYGCLMEDCEGIFRSVCRELFGRESFVFQGREIGLEKPWPRISVSEAFWAHACTSMQEALKAGTFNELMAFSLEPQLGGGRPVFLYDYPVELGALARARDDNPLVAERFECYIAGIELVNAFSELIDVTEQRTRFEKEMRVRAAAGKAVYPFPQKFIDCLEYMPQSAGAALGVDRLVMLFADKKEIDDVVAFTPEEL
jgi:elongation factor P--(R)-beta-lysine ligase